MTLYEFILLDEMEQQEGIWEGTYIGTRFDEEHNVLLYQIEPLVAGCTNVSSHTKLYYTV